jgi:hypothetical protein
MFSRRWLWRMPSSGIWRRVDLVWIDVSEERIASILRVEKSAREEPARCFSTDDSVCSHLITLVPLSRIFLPWGWWYVHPKRRFTHLHGATSQKTTFFSFTFLYHLVGIATGYELNDEGVAVQIPVGSRILSSAWRSDRFWSPPSLICNEYRG